PALRRLLAGIGATIRSTNGFGSLRLYRALYRVGPAQLVGALAALDLAQAVVEVLHHRANFLAIGMEGMPLVVEPDLAHWRQHGGGSTGGDFLEAGYFLAQI